MMSIGKGYNKIITANKRSGIVLVLVLVTLAVLATTVYTLSARLAIRRHRLQYLIDYQNSRYACDSAMKYALATAEEIELNLIIRTTEPDFSDVFNMDRDQYQEFLAEWAERKAKQQALEDINDQDEDVNDIPARKQDKDNSLKSIMQLFGDPNTTDPNHSAEADEDETIDPNTLVIPGPYGPAWPYVIEPMEFKIGDAKVTIEIEDENAKMPLTWAITSDPKVNRQAKNALKIFCEWMQMEPEQIEELGYQLKDLSAKKQFKLDLKSITVTEKVKTDTKTSRRTSRRRRRRRLRRSSRTKTTKRPAIAHTTDFAKLMHSSLLDLEALAAPLEDTGQRYESPLKYLALWGSQRVNINTAPRHVLEAAFTFGGEPEKIAHDIILRRREKPFKNIDDLKKSFYGYSDSIKKAEPYITTASTFLAIRVTAISGNARTSATATVIKQGKKVQRIAIMSW